MPEELQNLLNEVSAGLNNIQIGFDEYQKGYFRQKSSEFFCLELNGEAGELANFEKKQWKGENIDMAHFQDEVADVFIALMNYANEKNVNISDAVQKKLNKIEMKRLELGKNNQQY